MYTGNFPQEAARPPLVIDTTREFGTPRGFALSAE